LIESMIVGQVHDLETASIKPLRASEGAPKISLLADGAA